MASCVNGSVICVFGTMSIRRILNIWILERSFGRGTDAIEKSLGWRWLKWWKHTRGKRPKYSPFSRIFVHNMVKEGSVEGLFRSVECWDVHLYCSSFASVLVRQILISVVGVKVSYRLVGVFQSESRTVPSVKVWFTEKFRDFTRSVHARVRDWIM